MEQELQTIQDSLKTSETVATAFDSIWTAGNVPTAAPSPFEQVMLSNDKLYVVLVVVLVIWFGIIFFIYRTDRKLGNLERSLEDRIYDQEDEL